MNHQDWEALIVGDKIIMDEDARFLSGAKTSNYLEFEVLAILIQEISYEKIFVGRFDNEPGKSFWTPGGIAITLDMAMNWKQFTAKKLKIDSRSSIKKLIDRKLKDLEHLDLNDAHIKLFEQLKSKYPMLRIEYLEELSALLVILGPDADFIDVEFDEIDEPRIVTYRLLFNYGS